MKTLAETMEELKVRQKRAQIASAARVLFYVLALALAVMRLWPAAVAVAAASLLFSFLFVRKEQEGYSDAVAAANIRFGLCGSLGKAEYTGREGLTAAGLDAMELLPIQPGSDLLVRQGFSGEEDGLVLKGWEITFHYPDRTGGKTAHRFLSGTILTAEGGNASDMEADWLLIRKDLLVPAAREAFIQEKNYRLCDAPGLELGESFLVYTKGAGNEMPVHWGERFQKLAGETPSLGALRLSSGIAAAYLSNRFYTGRVSMRTLPAEGALKRNPLSERDGVWELFRCWAGAGTNL